MKRAFLLVPACLISFPLSRPAAACFVAREPTNQALVDVGLSSIAEPLRVATYRDSEGAVSCVAYLTLADLPSWRLAPRPREIAGSLEPVAKAFGAETCEISVVLEDLVRTADDEMDPDGCQQGTFRYAGGSWSTVEDDAPCW